MEAAPLILVVEDESSISDTILYALQTEGFTAQSCNTARQALSFLDDARDEKSIPQLIILDIGLPDINGIELCRRIRSSVRPLIARLPVLFLTARADEVDRVLGFEVGADDYVAKPFSPRELVARVRSIIRRTQEQTPSQHFTASTQFRIDEERMKIFFKEKALDLSRYEFRLLAVLVKRPGRVYSREELMSRAWEEPDMSLERTVDSHIKMIRAKLRALDPENDSIQTHRGMGYSLKEDGS